MRSLWLSMQVPGKGLKFKILGAGRSWPKTKYTNFDILKNHPETRDKPDDFLREMSRRIETGFGFESRYMTHLPGTQLKSEEATSESLSLEACRKALPSGKTPSLFLLGSTTSRRYTGSQATSVLGQLGIRAPAYELKAGCSTSLATLKLGLESLYATNKSVLVSCAETLSKVVHPGIRETWFGLADGGAALFIEKMEPHETLQPGVPAFELLQSYYSTDGKYVDLYTTPGDLPPRQEALDQNLYFLAGDSSALKEIAFKSYCEMIDQLFPNGNGLNSLVHLIPHQVNRALIDEVCKAKNITASWIWSAKEFGNLGGTSILFTLAQSIEEKKFQVGQDILLISVGGGLSSAALHLKVISI